MSRLQTSLVILASIAVLYFGQEVFIPLVLSMLLAMLLSGPVQKLEKWHVPRSAAVTACVLVAAGILFTIGWLVTVQTAPQEHFRAIGSNGFYRKGQERARFDQQPVEANATVSACLEAYRVTQDAVWLTEARSAFEWFLGRNDLGQELYDPSTGGCFDGLQEDRVNRNQGAESTLAFLLSLAEMNLLESSLAAFRQAR